MSVYFDWNLWRMNYISVWTPIDALQMRTIKLKFENEMKFGKINCVAKKKPYCIGLDDISVIYWVLQSVLNCNFKCFLSTNRGENAVPSNYIQMSHNSNIQSNRKINPIRIYRAINPIVTKIGAQKTLNIFCPWFKCHAFLWYGLIAMNCNLNIECEFKKKKPGKLRGWKYSCRNETTTGTRALYS